MDEEPYRHYWRVYTKTTGDGIVLTHHTVDALNGRSPELIDRGSHALKGKSPPCRFSASALRLTLAALD